MFVRIQRQLGDVQSFLVVAVTEPSTTPCQHSRPQVNKHGLDFIPRVKNQRIPPNRNRNQNRSIRKRKNSPVQLYVSVIVQMKIHCRRVRKVAKVNHKVLPF